jgi:translocation and assembly module TamB
LTLVAVVIVVLLFLLNSTQTIKWAADRYAPRYGFGYSSISGGLLTGLEVRELSYKGDRVFDSFKIRWNPASLLYDRVSITNLEATAIEVESIERMISSFSTKEEKKEENSTSVMPISIGISKLHMTLSPLEKMGVDIKSLSLDGEDIVYSSGGIDIDNALLSVDSNITDIDIALSLSHRVVKISKVSLLDIDTKAIEDIVESLPSDENRSKDDKSSRADNSDKVDNPLIPQRISIDDLKVAILPMNYPQATIDKAQIDSRDISVDLVNLSQKRVGAIEVKDLSIEVDSNLSKLSLQSSLKGDVVTIEKLSIQEIDTLALMQISLPKDSNVTDNNQTKVKGQESNTTNPLIPKTLIAKEVDISILPVTYDSIVVNSAEINGSHIEVDIPTLVAKDTRLDINLSTSLANFTQQATIKDNQIESRGSLDILKKLYETYSIPIRDGAIDRIPIFISANKNSAKVEIPIEANRLLVAKDCEFNIESLHLDSTILYQIPESKLTIESSGGVSTPYAKDMLLHNIVSLVDGELRYSGEVIPGKIEGIDANYTKPIDDLNISYEGNISSIVAYIDSASIKGRFISPNFKEANLTISTKSPILINDIVKLPKELREGRAEVDIVVPLDFAHITPLKAKADIRSNIANIEADLLYDKDIRVTTKSLFPKDTLLKGYGKELNIDALNPLVADVTIAKDIVVDINSQAIKSQIKLNQESRDIDGDLVIGGATFIFDGNLDKNVTLNNHIGSIKELVKHINSIYRFEAPPLDGDLKLSVVLSQMRDIQLKLYSKSLTYKANRTTDYTVDDTMVSLGFANSTVELSSYHTTFQKQRIFATKPSTITIEGDKIGISSLWINDQLEIRGEYNMSKKSGDILALADPLSISHQMIDLDAKIDIDTLLDGNKSDISGTITIQGGDLHIDMDKKSFASDSDILIVQDMKADKESSPFMDNLTALVKIDTDKPLLYKSEDANVKVRSDIQIQKAPKGPIYILGTAEIENGSYYSFQGKKFRFKKSIIAFTGDANKPILDIVAVYNSLHYEITIQVTGSPETPNIIFSSIPRLSREQILSVILFDSEDAGDGSSGDDMMKMMGGAMAKSALSNVGIKIDHLSLGSDGSMEVGKKISDKVTIIYVKDEVAGAKLQYDYSRDIKAIMSTDSESSGADIIYRKEF